jgi:hypothetical protein
MYFAKVPVRFLATAVTADGAAGKAVFCRVGISAEAPVIT